MQPDDPARLQQTTEYAVQAIANLLFIHAQGILDGRSQSDP